jgi:hypothetical protein
MKKEMVECLLDCLRDKDIKSINKKEALSVIPFIVMDKEALVILTKNHLEETLVDIIRNRNSEDSVIN